MYYYIQLDKEGVCVGTSQLSGQEPKTDTLIPISEEDYKSKSYIGKKYVNGQFIESGASLSNVITDEQAIMLALADLSIEIEEVKEQWQNYMQS